MIRMRNNTWLISDTHFGHHNIIAYSQRPATHEVIMLDNWITRVGEDDDILHLGDVFLGKQGNPKRWARIIARLPGRKYLILGNHDKQKPALYEDVAGFEIIDPFIERGIAFTHRPISWQWPIHYRQLNDRDRDILDPGAGWNTNIHGHTHNNPHRVGHDGVWVDGKRYINVSAEVTNLAPVQLGQVCPLPKGGTS